MGRCNAKCPSAAAHLSGAQEWAQLAVEGVVRLCQACKAFVMHKGGVLAQPQRNSGHTSAMQQRNDVRDRLVAERVRPRHARVALLGLRIFAPSR